MALIDIGYTPPKKKVVDPSKLTLEQQMQLKTISPGYNITDNAAPATGLDSVNPSKFLQDQLPIAGQPDFSGMPAMPGAVTLPGIGEGTQLPGETTLPGITGYQTPEYRLEQDPYAQAALGTLGETQERTKAQYIEDLRKMGLRGAGTTASMLEDLATGQTREKALLGGELTERARAGQLSEVAAKLGIETADVQRALAGGQLGLERFQVGEAAGLGREQAKINAAVQQSNIDLGRYKAGVMTSSEKERLRQNATQLGLNRSQIEAGIKEAEQKFDFTKQQYKDTIDRAVAEKDEMGTATNLHSLAGALSQTFDRAEVSRISAAIQKRDPGTLWGDGLRAYNELIKVLDKVPPEYRKSAEASLMNGLITGGTGEISGEGKGNFLTSILPTLIKTGLGVVTGGVSTAVTGGFGGGLA